jgi:hypothetical protein
LVDLALGEVGEVVQGGSEGLSLEFVKRGCTGVEDWEEVGYAADLLREEQWDYALWGGHSLTN